MAVLLHSHSLSLSPSPSPSPSLAPPFQSRPVSFASPPPTLLSIQSSFKSLSFSISFSSSNALFGGGSLAMEPVKRSIRGSAVVCEAAPKKKADSAVKRARQAEKRRLYNKAKKSEIKTRMKKVFEALDVLKKKSDAQSEEILPVEKLIAEAYSAIDKAVKSGTLHRNTGAHRKSRLARRKKSVETHHGWYSPAAAGTA